MKIYRSSIPSGNPLKVDETFPDFPKEKFEQSYPLLGIKNPSIVGIFEKPNDIVIFNGTISGTLILADARTNEPFEEEVSVDGVISLLEDGLDEDAEGYIFPGNGIEVEEVVYSVLRSETPLKPLKKGSKCLTSGDGWSVRMEGEEEETHSSPFDVLADYSFDSED
ncbi:MAG: DUF177 domain-containing protein [Candidatus Enteromonas sp.]|nr:DUF177 domain-containing protein [Candidatus Enteromonas sp.]